MVTSLASKTTDVPTHSSVNPTTLRRLLSPNHANVTSSKIINQTKHVVDYGILPKYLKTTFAVNFQNHPLWLLSLEPRYVKELHFPYFTSAKSLREHRDIAEHLDFYEQVLSQFRGITTFKTTIQKQFTFHLTSGSKDWLDSSPTCRCKHQIQLVHTSFRVRASSTTAGISTISYSALGGATTFRSSYKLSNKLRHPKHSNIKRNIQTYLEFGDQATLKIPPHGFLKANTRLPIKSLDSYVRMRHEYGKDCFVYRKLHRSELAFIFGLPNNLHPFTNNKLRKQLIPLHIGDSLLKDNLPVKNPTTSSPNS